MASNKNRQRQPVMAELKSIVIELTDGSMLNLDINAVTLVDIKTQKPLFKHVSGEQK